VFNPTTDHFTLQKLVWMTAIDKQDSKAKLMKTVRLALQEPETTVKISVQDAGKNFLTHV